MQISGREAVKVRTLTRVRQAELYLLLILAAALLLHGPQPLTVALEAVLLSVVLVLAKSRRDEARAGWSVRLQRLDELQSQAVRLYVSHMLPPNPTSWEQTRDLLLANYEIEKWVDRVRSELQQAPEFAPIFEAHGGGGPREQLRGRMRRLREIRGLIEASRRVGFRR